MKGKRERLKSLVLHHSSFFVGQKLLIIKKDGVKRITVKKVIPMRRHNGEKFLPPHDHEILFDKKNNQYFSLDLVMQGMSYVLAVFEREALKEG